MKCQRDRAQPTADDRRTLDIVVAWLQADRSLPDVDLGPTLLGDRGRVPAERLLEGSYLNVGVTWLWYAKDYWSFDYGDRVEGFASFRDVHQFAIVAERLATRAAEEVGTLRKKFASVRDIAREITPHANARGWPVYHAAVATGLVGDVAASSRLFGRFIEGSPTTEWQSRRQADSAALAQNLPDVDKFRAATLAIIKDSRTRHGLPPDAACLDLS